MDCVDCVVDCIWLICWYSVLLLLDDVVPNAISELLLDDFVDDCTLCSEERFETLCVEVRNDIIETKPAEKKTRLAREMERATIYKLIYMYIIQEQTKKECRQGG